MAPNICNEQSVKSGPELLKSSLTLYLIPINNETIKESLNLCLIPINNKLAKRILTLSSIPMNNQGSENSIPHIFICCELLPNASQVKFANKKSAKVT